MHITRYTDYSLRTLIYLGVNGGKLATIQEISRAYDISRNHLMKIVHELSLKGYIDSIRGKNGGIRLQRAPEDINLGTLVRDVEQSFVLSECFGPDNSCAITPACRMKKVLSEALMAFFVVLESYTLADLIGPELQPQLINLLQIT